MVVMCGVLLYRVPPWLQCELDFNTEYNLGCYECWTVIQSTTLVVMCVGLLHRAQHWLLYVLDFYAQYNLGCYML